MKKFNRFLSALLVCAMALSLVACGQPADDKTTAAPDNKTTEASGTEAPGTEAPGTEAPTEAETFEVNYPVDTDVKLSIFSMYPSLHASYATWQESPYHTTLEKNTGIYVDFQLVTSAERKTKYNLIWTSELKDIPKMVVNNYTPEELDALADENMIWDLTEYVEQYAPDYWAYINKEGNEALLNGAYTGSGRILSINSFLESDSDLTYIGPVIRQDWLDECGLKAPVTIADWEKVLVAFKDKYGVAFGFSIARFKEGFASGFGAYTCLGADVGATNLYLDDNGKIQFAAVQPEYKEMLVTLNKWYEMGLIDLDSFSMNNNALIQKASTGKIGVAFASSADLTKIQNGANAEGGAGGNWVGISYPRTEAGAATNWIQTQNKTVAATLTAITKSASEEEMIACLQWLNYGFTEEGFLYQNFGTQGESYELDANGNPVYTNLVKNEAGNVDATLLSKYIGNVSSVVGGIKSSQSAIQRNAELNNQAISAWIENTEVSKHFLPSFPIDAEKSSEYTDKMAMINTRVAEMAMKFIVGEESLDKFDDYVKELESYGLADCLAIKQAGYDAFASK